MTLQHLKRIAALEARHRPPERPWTDPEWIRADFEATIEGRPFSRIPPKEPVEPLSEEDEQARRRLLAEFERMAARLEQDDPGGAARFQADRERRLAANLRALEREQAEREAA